MDAIATSNTADGYHGKDVMYPKPNLRLEVWLHRLGGTVLLAYSLSHFGFLRISGVPEQHYYNTVFPFLTNWYMYLIAALLEAFLGILCLKAAGRDFINLTILAFIAVMVWYRWAFHYTGGSNCNCLGMLGMLLHLPKRQANAIPILTLIILALTTIPRLYRKVVNSQPYFDRCMLACILLLVHQVSYAVTPRAQTVEISGTLDLQEYRPSGKPFLDQQSHSKFKVVLSGTGWKMEVTNKDRTNWWNELVYDGTNSYVIQPSGGEWYTTNSPKNTEYTVSIEPSARYLPVNPDPMGLYMLWFTYGLSTGSTPTNKMGLLDLPLVSGHPRDNPNAYGFKWLIHWADNGRFASHFLTVRDRLLDVAEEQEFQRPELDYPDTLGTYNEYKSNLDYRRALPTGFVKYAFRCSDWYSTNSLSIPEQSELSVFLNDRLTNRPYRKVTLKADEITTREGVETLLPDMPVLRHVVDYRYKKRNEERIFKYAEYTLRGEDGWKPGNDPQLLKQADDWLAHGRKYKSYADKSRNWSAWILLMSILVGPLMIYWYNRKHKQ